MRSSPPSLPSALVAVGLFFGFGCTAGVPSGETVQFTVPAGASFAQVTDTLHARGLVGAPTLFRAFARYRGIDTSVRAGVYRVESGIRWVPLLDQLQAGQVVTLPMTIPEGFTLRQMAPRIAAITGLPQDEVEAELYGEGQSWSEELWGVPGPGLEGYLFPDTYRFSPGSTVELVIATMVARYQAFWTEERRARAEELGFTEQEITTLASIVQGEAARVHEMPLIAGVFHHRLRIGYLLQADPTVQYALGDRRSRLLYADIDSVAEHPYNTYTRGGLPPGPIGAPGEAALLATLYPEETRHLYFVARPDGTHIFTSSLEAHNQARVQARREWDAAARSSDGGE